MMEDYMHQIYGDQEDREEEMEKIRQIPPHIMRKFLIKVVNSINKYDWTLERWVRFKYNILKGEEEAKTSIFGQFGIPGIKEIPLIQLKWPKIKDSSVAMFCVYMIFSNDFPGNLPNVWPLIDGEEE